MANLDRVYPEHERQQAFVDHLIGTLVALAGPGTGKTYSFLLRIAELTEKRGIDCAAICYLTFTREIVRAFKDDLLLKYPGAVRPQSIAASTLHSLACRLIRNKGHRIRLAGALCILNLCDSRDSIAKVAISDIKSLLPQGMKGIVSENLMTIKTQWQQCQPVGNLTVDAAIVEQKYEQYSRALRLLDWDEVIPLAVSLYKDQKDRPNWITKYKHLLIDEYQDFNMAEQSFLEFISGSAVSCAVVGDDDQSIYSTRGASPDGIRALAKSPSADSISLVQCRRCAEKIVQSANQFLSFMHADPRHLKVLKAGGTVAIKSFRSAVAEADYLAGYMKVIMSRMDLANASQDKGIVCLFPTHKVLKQYRKEFEARGLKCKCRDSSNSLDNRMWARLLAKLAFQRSQPFLERLILDRFPAFKPRHKKGVLTALLGGYPSVISALASVAPSDGWREPTLTAVSDYTAFVDSLTSRDTSRVASCIDLILTGGRRCDPGHVDKFLATTDEAMLEESLDILIDKVFSDGTAEGGDVQLEPAVEMLTLHSSKGLTRRYVVLPGLEHCWLPGDATGAELEEKKRLFLVGITRATESLLITYPLHRARNDSLNYPVAGREELSDFARHLGVPLERC